MNEQSINPKAIQKFKRQLLQSKSDLLSAEEAAKDSSDTVVLDQSRLGRLSRMDAMQAQQMALEAARRRELQVVKIDGALRRIDNDEFGECFECGKEINILRLGADPTCTRCIDCADK